MKRILVRLFLGLVLVIALVAAVGSGLDLYRYLTRPTLEQNGGTVLVYEVDPEKKVAEDVRPDELADALRRRLDPDGWSNVSVRLVGDSRVEIGIPRTKGHDDRVEQFKQLVAQVGHLEFRIAANTVDDAEALKAAAAHVEDDNNKPRLKALADAGKPPPPPSPPGGDRFKTSKGDFSYQWVELGRPMCVELGLTDAAGPAGSSAGGGPAPWHKELREKAARHRGKAMTLDNGTLLYSRECRDRRLSAGERDRKAVDYFLLLRSPALHPATGELQAVTGEHLADATVGKDQRGQPCLDFRFGSIGADRFHALTLLNLPNPGPSGEPFRRAIAIILDGQILSVPMLIAAIRDRSQIVGKLTPEEVNRLVAILRAGALPATLKPVPVSETVVEPKSGAGKPPS